MRRSAALLLSVLLLGIAGPAFAIPEGGPENWTETWIMPGDEDPTVEFMSGSEQYDLFPIDASVDVFDFFPCDQAQQCEPSGILLEVTIPNFIDPLTRKEIRIRIEGGNPDPSLPSVLEVTGFDIPFGSDQQEPDVIAGFQTGQQGFQTDTGFLWKEQWEIHPNPDWEIIRIFIPYDFEWLKLHITTESLGEPVPEPSALILVGFGMLGLLVMGRPRS